MDNPWICQRSLFSKIFNRLLFGRTLQIYLPNLKSVSLPVPEIGLMVIGVLGGVANPQSLGTEGCRGSGMEPFERTLVSSYRHCIVDFPFTRFRDRLLTFLTPDPPTLQTDGRTHERHAIARPHFAV